MMKTPEDIKKGLGACKVEGDCDRGNCPYHNFGGGTKCIPAMSADALAYIRQLEMENASLDKAIKDAAEVMVSGEKLIRKRIEEFEAKLDAKQQFVKSLQNTIVKLTGSIAQARRERDAAVHDINRCCGTCKHFQNEEDNCTAEECIGSGSYMEPSSWEWRGPCPENTKEDSK